MKIAIVTPWPGDRSGIADYSYDLVKGLLVLGENVSVFTCCSDPKPLGGLNIVNEDYASWDFDAFDIIVYHFGNNIEFHGHMLSLLKRFKGVVHLHDYVLHHMTAGMAQTKYGWEWYFELLNKYHGEDTVNWVRGLWEKGVYVWESEYVTQIPMNEEVLSYASAVITHSQFALKGTRAKFSLLPAMKIHQVYDMVEPEAKQKDRFVLGVFGHVQPNKCIDQLLDALAQMESKDVKIEIKVAGKIADEVYHSKLLEKLELVEDFVTFNVMGYLSDEEFIGEIKNSDVVVALRYPTMGETSAVAMRALQLGKPLVVTDIGWYSELPPFVYKIEVGNEGTLSLARELENLICAEGRLSEIEKETIEYAHKHLCFKSVCHAYADALRTLVQSEGKEKNSLSSFEEINASKLYELNMTEVVGHKPHREYVYKKVTNLLN